MNKAPVALVIVLALGGCENPAVEAVKSKLRDPGSAKFEDVRKCSGDNSITSGSVNAKNAMGAYTGSTPFFVDGAQVFFPADTGFSQVMERCYEGLADLTDGEEEIMADADLADPSDWLTNTDVNPIDDSKTASAMLNAQAARSSYGDPVTLVIRCQSNTTEMYVVWNDYLGDDSHSVYDEYKLVTSRIPPAAAQEHRWGVSTDSQATFYPGSPIATLREMAKSEKYVLQTTPYNESPVTAEFDLSGIEDALQPIADTCNWEF